MKIFRDGIDTFKGPAEWFTGDVYVDFMGAPDGTRVNAANVHFTPGARTHWHSHNLGQLIFVTEGEGRCQKEGGPVEVLLPGTAVFFEPHELHWHGAAPNRFMVHVAMQAPDESADANVWGDPVTDEQYEG
ncbi:Cupin domain protein [Cohaesibacter marisflavi]|uniref:Cupin domain protein n=1 Tax=Cohaesibacter marisflavi TaxID=655353 RepID=A0A1I5G4S6_9HYPH|nr:cupin domain-containing protein [Cohaesibacter marisflavi]SFO31058.1 Cupin domain protein [Cohaesibacter marisflavi]